MQKRQLGTSGAMVSAIGVGCWSFAGAYGPTDEAESHAVLAQALDLGINFLDTADVYGGGVSERCIASFVRNSPCEFIIATKGGIRRDKATNTRIFDNSAEHLRFALEKSLTDLGVEHVPLYYIHRRDAEQPIEDTMEILVRFKDEGKIGGIGFSEISPGTLRRAHAVHPVMAVQNEYSLWSRMPELGIIQACKELGVAFVPFSPLGRGMLTSNTPEPDGFAPSDFRYQTPRFSEPNFTYNVKALAPFKAMAADMGASPEALALAWILSRGEHLIPVPGTRYADHLRSAVAGEQLRLTTQDLAEIDRILPPGFAHGDRYSQAQLAGAERYC